MPFATAPDGTKLHYTVDDYTDPWKNAPHIILQHGFGRNGRFWYRWVPYLARHYKVLRIDMRGFGQSREGFSLTRDFSLDDLTDDVKAVLDHANIEQAHYCGEAFGGTLGMQFAATYPDRLRTLNLMSSPVFLHQTTQQDFAIGESSWSEALRKHGVKAWANGTNTITRFPPEMGQDFLGWYSDELSHTDQETLAHFSELCRRYDQTHFLSKITAPTLAVFPKARDEQVELLQKHVRDLSVIRLPTQYFMIYLINPRACADAVLHFAAQHDGMNIWE
jgi:3-oxoadipate enol-lactonase